MKHSAKASGTCGELVQGYLQGKDFLINSPIPLFAQAIVSLRLDHNIKIEDANKYSKIKQILEKLREYLNMKNQGFNVQIESKIPRGKGLASSTSELTAVLLAASEALKITLSDREIVNLLLAVDGSSDGVFLPGITNCNHLNGDIYKSFSNIPSISFIIIDTGGEVSTQQFDRDNARAVATEQEFSLRLALSWLEKGFITQDSEYIAKAATISARVNQNVLYKSPLETLIEGTREFGGLGVNCAHTGSVLGVMFDHSTTQVEPLLERIHDLVHPLPILGVYPLIGGGRTEGMGELNTNDTLYSM